MFIRILSSNHASAHERRDEIDLPAPQAFQTTSRYLTDLIRTTSANVSYPYRSMFPHIMSRALCRTTHAFSSSLRLRFYLLKMARSSSGHSTYFHSRIFISDAIFLPIVLLGTSAFGQRRLNCCSPLECERLLARLRNSPGVSNSGSASDFISHAGKPSSPLVSCVAFTPPLSAPAFAAPPPRQEFVCTVNRYVQIDATLLWELKVENMELHTSLYLHVRARKKKTPSNCTVLCIHRVSLGS